MLFLIQLVFQHCLPRFRDVAVTVEKALLHLAVGLGERGTGDKSDSYAFEVRRQVMDFREKPYRENV